jgi:hypothetical protein
MEGWIRAERRWTHRSRCAWYWTPVIADSHFTLTSDYQGQPPQPDAVEPMTFMLHVALGYGQVEHFSFDVVITSQG